MLNFVRKIVYFLFTNHFLFHRFVLTFLMMTVQKDLWNNKSIESGLAVCDSMSAPIQADILDILHWFLLVPLLFICPYHETNGELFALFMLTLRVLLALYTFLPGYFSYCPYLWLSGMCFYPHHYSKPTYNWQTTYNNNVQHEHFTTVYVYHLTI